MTSGEIRAAIERLEKYNKEDHSVDALMCRFIGGKGWLVSELRDVLVSLLRQADPDAHMELPRDADGEVIHVGDELCSYGRPDGGVFCKATNGYMVFVGRDGDYAPRQWMEWDPDDCNRYHKPTFESVLYEMAGEIMALDKPFDLGAVVAEYAERLREVTDYD